MAHDPFSVSRSRITVLVTASSVHVARRLSRMSCAALRAQRATRSSASSALMSSLYSSLFRHAPMMPREELTMRTGCRRRRTCRRRRAVPPCAPYPGPGRKCAACGPATPCPPRDGWRRPPRRHGNTRCADGFGAPALHQVRDMLVHALASGKFELLQFAAGWVGGAYQYEDVLVGTVAASTNGVMPSVPR